MSCHPACPERSQRERSDATFSPAPHCGALGCVVEGSLLLFFLVVFPSCRRKPALECGRCSRLCDAVRFLPYNSIGAPVSPLKAAASRRTPKCRRADIFRYVTIKVSTPTPMFCVSAGIIGLTGECRRCRGMIGVSGGLRPKKRRESKGRSEK